jgi:hypothetical protein
MMFIDKPLLVRRVADMFDHRARHREIERAVRKGKPASVADHFTMPETDGRTESGPDTPGAVFDE